MSAMCFDVNDAVKYGVDCAVLLEYMRVCFWAERSRSPKNKTIDGFVWTEKDLAFSFPFWNLSYIQGLLYKVGLIEGIDISFVGNDIKVNTDWSVLNEKR